MRNKWKMIWHERGEKAGNGSIVYQDNLGKFACFERSAGFCHSFILVFILCFLFVFNSRDTVTMCLCITCCDGRFWSQIWWSSQFCGKRSCHSSRSDRNRRLRVKENSVLVSGEISTFLFTVWLLPSCFTLDKLLWPLKVLSWCNKYWGQRWRPWDLPESAHSSACLFTALRAQLTAPIWANNGKIASIKSEILLKVWKL